MNRALLAPSSAACASAAAYAAASAHQQISWQTQLAINSVYAASWEADAAACAASRCYTPFYASPAAFAATAAYAAATFYISAAG